MSEEYLAIRWSTALAVLGVAVAPVNTVTWVHVYDLLWRPGNGPDSSYGPANDGWPIYASSR
jgi:hypothetical protein